MHDIKKQDHEVDMGEDDEPGFLKRNRILIALLFVIATGAFGVKKVISGSGREPAPKAERFVMVALPPPPPPPPPPPKTEPPPQQKEEKMIEETQPTDEKPPQQAPPEQAPAATGIKGDGTPDGFGLIGSGGGNGMIGGGNTHSGSKYGWYAGQVQQRIAEALRNNRRTRTASISAQVRIWADSTGKVIRAKLAASTGDPAMDEVIQNEVLNGLQLTEPPPKDMPMPIVLRLNARRPH